uniref:RanBD1 domain-containing protein n=1 Tax=Arion vulgaris TaxID=1028688 RepID=A0A0B7A2H5_9EUPU
MAKRGPSSDLNDRNWDEEEEPEEAGVFAQASKDTLEHRVIKRAKRTRVPGDNADSSSGAFSGFSGFGAKIAAAANTNAFSGFKKLDGDTASNSKPIIFGGTSSINGNEDQKLKGQVNTKESSSYLGCLKSLNESVLAWIKQHVDSNPYIILTPVFKDYEKYLDVIQTKKFPTSGTSSSSRDDGTINQSTDSVPSSSSKITSSVLTTPASKPNDDDDEGKQSEVSKTSVSLGQTSTEPTKAFSFGQASTEPSKAFIFGQAPSESTKPFSFSQTTAQSSISGGFSFTPSGGSTGAAVKFTSASSTTPGAGFFFSQSNSGSSSLFSKSTLSSSGSTNSSQGLFSFGKTAQQESTSTEGSQDVGDKDNEEYEPPKPEVKEVVEADALYSKRCKLYYQKDGQWVDRGVGNLHLKPVSDSKTQLLVRADTNLGNILLNIMLSSSTPVSRQGKNNVVLVTVANPPIKTGDEESTPIPMLIRVKTGEEADELLKIIEERKKLL